MISLAKETDLKQVVSLHKKVLPHTFNSLIGLPFLTLLYQNILTDNHSQLWVKKQNQTVIAFLSVTQDLHLLNKKVQAQSNLKSLILTHLLTHPHHSLNLLKKIVFSVFLKKNFPGQQAWILTLGVHPRFTRQGIAKSLLQQVISDYQKKKLKVISVDTETNNSVAIRFYRSLNFSSVKQSRNNLILQKTLT